MPGLSFRFRVAIGVDVLVALHAREGGAQQHGDHIQAIVLPRLPAISAWCAMVSVTPRSAAAAVLIVGSGRGPMVWKGSTMPAGEAGVARTGSARRP